MPYGRAGSIAIMVATAALLIAATGLFGLPSRGESRPSRLLYFTLSAGYRHEVIPASREVMRQLGAASPQFEVTESEDVAVFTAENSRGATGEIMFFTTGGLPMSEAQRAALMDFVSRGGGFLGVHSATRHVLPMAGVRQADRRLLRSASLASDRARRRRRSWRFAGVVPRAVDNAQRRDLSGPRLRRARLACAATARSDFGRSSRARRAHHPYGWPLAWTAPTAKAASSNRARPRRGRVARPGFQRSCGTRCRGR